MDKDVEKEKFLENLRSDEARDAIIEIIDRYQLNRNKRSVSRNLDRSGITENISSRSR